MLHRCGELVVDQRQVATTIGRLTSNDRGFFSRVLLVTVLRIAIIDVLSQV